MKHKILVNHVTPSPALQFLAILLIVAMGVVRGQSPEQNQNVDSVGKYRFHEPAAGAPVTRSDEEAKMRGSLHIERDGADKVRIGSVMLDAKRRTVTFPAIVNMDSGVIEYAVVSDYGKVHESLFRTTAKPQEVHLACLLLNGAPAKEPATAGRPVRVFITWDTNGAEAQHDLGEMIAIAKDPSTPENAVPLPIQPWTYTGSVTDTEGFAATREGSIISLIPDPSALINNPGESSKRDDNHFPNKNLVPAKDRPVRIVLGFPPTTRMKAPSTETAPNAPKLEP